MLIRADRDTPAGSRVRARLSEGREQSSLDTAVERRFGAGLWTRVGIVAGRFGRCEATVSPPHAR